MKKIVIAAFAAVAMAMAFIGCDKIPTVEQMTATSTAVGAAAGTVMNITKIGNVERNVVVDIVNEVKSCVPNTNETFTAAWTPIAKRHVDKLVSEKKIDAAAGAIVVSMFQTACSGIDYLFDVRYPKAREYEELVKAGIHGFTSGLLDVFKPANAEKKPAPEIDKAAYEYLMMKR